MDLWHLNIMKVCFFNCYLAAPRPTLGHYRGDSLTHLMLINAFLHLTQGSPGASWWDWVPKPGRAPSGVWTGNLPILTTTPWPTRRLSPLSPLSPRPTRLLILTLWTMNYVDCVPFSSIISFHIVRNLTNSFNKIISSNFQKTWNLH